MKLDSFKNIENSRNLYFKLFASNKILEKNYNFELIIQNLDDNN